MIIIIEPTLWVTKYLIRGSKRNLPLEFMRIRNENKLSSRPTQILDQQLLLTTIKTLESNTNHLNTIIGLNNIITIL